MNECDLKGIQWVFDGSKPLRHTWCDGFVKQCDYCRSKVCGNHREKTIIRSEYGYYIDLNVCNVCIANNEDILCSLSISYEALNELREIYQRVVTKRAILTK
tara:strand:+ start:2090 stop:2395 length:306 start_codon:yes stop_codon:yes gene_type:complete